LLRHRHPARHEHLRCLARRGTRVRRVSRRGRACPRRGA
jgi:hypothetical protein